MSAMVGLFKVTLFNVYPLVIHSITMLIVRVRHNDRRPNME